MIRFILLFTLTIAFTACAGKQAVDLSTENRRSLVILFPHLSEDHPQSIAVLPIDIRSTALPITALYEQRLSDVLKEVSSLNVITDPTAANYHASLYFSETSCRAVAQLKIKEVQSGLTRSFRAVHGRCTQESDNWTTEDSEDAVGAAGAALIAAGISAAAGDVPTTPNMNMAFNQLLRDFRQVLEHISFKQY